MTIRASHGTVNLRVWVYAVLLDPLRVAAPGLSCVTKHLLTPRATFRTIDGFRPPCTCHSYPRASSLGNETAVVDHRTGRRASPNPPHLTRTVRRRPGGWGLRFEKNDILRIVRALAIVRPSFIALQMPMTEEDDVFVEKCFQRSLIELDKLVSFSGTPTVAWRRTGEICLVGPEFCMLTGWEREELVGPGKRKYIYEVCWAFPLRRETVMCL